MKVYPEEQTTLIVHPDTRTIIKADEVALINTDDTAIWPEADALIETAEVEGGSLADLFVVLVGNVIDGIDIVGPFFHVTDAQEWASESPDQWTWTIKRITTPAEASS
jgi:hypothetical protein